MATKGPWTVWKQEVQSLICWGHLEHNIYSTDDNVRLFPFMMLFPATAVKEWGHLTSVCMDFFESSCLGFLVAYCFSLFSFCQYKKTAEEFSTRRPEALKIRLVSKTASENPVKRNVDFLRTLFGKRQWFSWWMHLKVLIAETEFVICFNFGLMDRGSCCWGNCWCCGGNSPLSYWYYQDSPPGRNSFQVLPTLGRKKYQTTPDMLDITTIPKA